jgi:hypothetical protein
MIKLAHYRPVHLPDTDLFLREILLASVKPGLTDTDLLQGKSTVAVKPDEQTYVYMSVRDVKPRHH